MIGYLLPLAVWLLVLAMILRDSSKHAKEHPSNHELEHRENPWNIPHGS